MKKEVAISLPFSIDPYGKVAVTEEQTKIWADRVRSVIGTTVKERVMRPEFGTTIAYKVFENETVASNDIKVNVEKVFNERLRTLKLIKVDTNFDTYSGTVNIDVTYSLPNDTVLTTTIGLITIVNNNPPTEEMI